MIVWLIEWSESTLTKNNLAAPRILQVAFVAKCKKQAKAPKPGESDHSFTLTKIHNCNFKKKGSELYWKQKKSRYIKREFVFICLHVDIFCYYWPLNCKVHSTICYHPVSFRWRKHIYTQNILICNALNVPQNVGDCISSGRPDDASTIPLRYMWRRVCKHECNRPITVPF